MAILGLESGTAAVVVAIVAAVPGALAFMASRRKDDGDVALRRDDAAWSRLQATLDRQDDELQTVRSELAKLQSDFVMLQHKYHEALEHGERCDVALEDARRDLADLKRRLDERGQ